MCRDALSNFPPITPTQTFTPALPLDTGPLPSYSSSVLFATRHRMITIDIHPNLFSGDLVGSFVVSWHGFLTFVAVLVAVVLVGRWAPMKGIDQDAIYSIAIWAIIGGIIGARLVHVIDNWDIYQDDPAQILAVWSGGIGLWGGILGGFIGGATYAYFAKQPVGVIADLTAPVLPFAQSIGRIGDIINGEHCAKPLDLFFGMRWTNAEAPAVQCANGGALTMDYVHPVIVYEILWNMLSMVVLWLLRDRIHPDGMLFAPLLGPLRRRTLRHHLLPRGQGLGTRNAGGPLHRARRPRHHRPPPRGARKVHEEGRDRRRRYPASPRDPRRAPPQRPLSSSYSLSLSPTMGDP